MTLPDWDSSGRFLALAMSLFMLSLAGFPPLAGFTGKFYVFRSAVLSGHTESRHHRCAQQPFVGDLLFARDCRDVHGRGRRRGKIVSPSAVRLHCRRHGADRHDLSGSYSSQGPRLEPDFFLLPRLVRTVEEADGHWNLCSPRHEFLELTRFDVELSGAAPVEIQ